jgi:hypothetical protein
MLFGMCINGFEAWKFQNACRSNSEHHSKPTMDINSQHHNLLGNQISLKSEDFCIWWPFCTLVTMVTAAILNFSNPQKLPHTTVDIPTNVPAKSSPTHFSATTERKSMKLHRNVKHYE